MNAYEKSGLFLIILYFGSNFPEFWRGGEILIGLIGWFLFLGGKQIEEVVDAFRTV